MVRRKMRQILVYSTFFPDAMHKSEDSMRLGCYNRRFPGSSLADVPGACPNFADAGLRTPQATLKGSMRQRSDSLNP